MEINRKPEFVNAFALAYGAKQTAVVVHGGGINPKPFVEKYEAEGLVAVEMEDHTRLYQLPKVAGQ